MNGESFGFDTIRIKENNLRIRAVDTSSTASFPSRDWQLTFNDSSNGGANKFSVDDIDGGRTPFTIEAGAPSHSLYVDDGGRLGLGTSTPVVDVHIKSGNTPTLRLEQDGSSGFTPQTWDVAGNEANFFIRDATNGSTLPFRIFPGAPSNAVNIEAGTSDVGLGDTSPDAALEVERSNGTAQILVTEANGTDTARTLLSLTNNGTVRIDLNDSSVGTDFWRMAAENDLGRFIITRSGTAVTELELDSSGNLTIQGQCSEGVTGSCADYVFEPDYVLPSLQELEAFIAENKHLPNVPSTEEIKAKGLNVQNFQGRLLEKIEELTLYTLQQEEAIKALKDRLEALEKK